MNQIALLKNSLIYLSLIICFSSCKRENNRAVPYYNSPDFTPIFLQNKNLVSDSISHKISNFSFTDQNEKTITQKDIAGKISVADFIFTSCTNICPKITHNLKMVSQYFKNDSNVVILSFTVTPWIDSVATLEAYKKNNGITNKNWHFLTGDKSKIYTLARKSYFAGGELGFTKDSTYFLHTEHVLLVDKNKRIRGIYDGTLQVDMSQLIKDIEALKKEDKK